MPIEIERKFLVTSNEWRTLGKAVAIRQAYLSKTEKSTTRIRIYGEKAYLTIKGKSFANCARLEYEYEIPIADAEEILTHLTTGWVIFKERTRIPYNGHIIEVDEFFNENQGLVIAEIELSKINEHIDDKPIWLGDEVTHLGRYSNAALASHPYSTWSDDEKAGVDSIKNV